MTTPSAEQIAAAREALKALEGTTLRAYVTAAPGPGQTDPPGQEFLFSFAVTEPGVTPPPVPEPPPKPLPTPYFVVGDFINIRNAPNGNIQAQATRGTQLDIDSATLRDATVSGVTHKWGQIASANYAGEWVAVDLLSVTRPQ